MLTKGNKITFFYNFGKVQLQILLVLSCATGHAMTWIC